MHATDDHGSTPLHWAANHTNHPEVLRVLLEHGAQLDATTTKGNTPLQVAESKGNPVATALLSELRQGAVASALADLLELLSDPGATAQGVRALIDRGADVNAVGAGGRTPLFEAAMNARSPQVMSVLVEVGADLQATDA